MERGTKLYRVSWASLNAESIDMIDAALVTVTFIEESIVEGASVPTYVVRDEHLSKADTDCMGSRLARVSRHFYHETISEAWKEFIRELEIGILAQKEQLEKHHMLLEACEAQLKLSRIIANKEK